MKRISAILLGVSLVISGAGSVHADEMIGEQFQIFHPDVYSVGVLIDDTTMMKKQWATLQAFTGDRPGNTGKPTSLKDCSSFGSLGCEADKYFNFKSMLPYCANVAAYNCISELVATGPDGVEHKANYVEDFPGKTEYSFVGNDSVNLPASGTNFIVSIPSLPHSQGDKYLVSSTLMGDKPGVEKKFRVHDFITGIFAVKMIDGTYTTPSSSSRLSDYTDVGMTAGGGLPMDLSTNKLATCAQVTTTRCAMPYPLPLDVNFEMTLRMKIPVTGWLHGRLGEASASISLDKANNQIIKIGGKPQVVPIVYKLFPKAELPKVITDFYANDPNFELKGYRFGTSTGEVSTIKILDQYSTQEFPAALAWYQAISDRAPYAASVWTFRSIQQGNLGQGCVNDSKTLNGLVSTNSNMYVAEPPTFNKSDLTLDYKVTSPHYLPDGSVFKGTYNLVINSEFARCIYGFTKAPVAATVSILSANGTEQVATTVLSEKNGWLRLSASNFTFSSPTIKVRLTQQGAPKAAKKYSIYCQNKAGHKQEFNGVNPKCPKGYKKVAK